MADEVEQLFVHEVEIGVGNMDMSTGDGVVSSTRVVVERAKGADRATGQERELLLVYEATGAPAIADAMRTAAEHAGTAP